MVKHIPKYKVFLDSNAIRDKEWVKTDLFERLNGWRGEKLATVDFYLPEIIKEEWLHHYRTLAGKHQSDIERYVRQLNSMGLMKESGKHLDEEAFNAAAIEQLRLNRIYIVDTPYEEMNWPTLLNRAVRHKPPFEVDSDKGIKDALFAHTVLSYFNSHSKQRNTRIVVITNDSRLQEYLGELLDPNKVLLHSTLEDFGSNLRLTIDELSATLLSNAKSVFFTPKDPESIYTKEGIGKQISTRYQELIGSDPRTHITNVGSTKLVGDYPLPNDESWLAMDRKFSIVETTFTGRKSGRLQWSTKVGIKQAYALSTQNYDGMVLNNPTSVVHGALFTVKWSSKLGSPQEVTSPKVESVELTEEKVEVDPYAGIDYRTGTTNLTRSSQPKQLGLQSVLDALRGLGVENAEAIRESLRFGNPTISQAPPPNLTPVKMKPSEK